MADDAVLKIGVDVSGVQQGVKDVQSLSGLLETSLNKKRKVGLLEGVESQITGFKAQISNIAQAFSGGDILGGLTAAEGAMAGLGPIMGAVAIAAGGVAVAVTGMWSAMSRGKELTLIAEQSGVTVTELTVLEKAFARVGMTTEELPNLMGRFASEMQTIGDPSSKASLALRKLGLAFGDLQGKTQFEQFKLVASGFDSIKSSAEKAALAREIFGKSGARLLPILNAQAVPGMMQNIPEAAKVYEEVGPLFAAFQAKVKSLALSFQPFFLGMAEQIIPPLMNIVSKFDKIDLTSMGREFATSIAEAAWSISDAMDDMRDAGETFKKFVEGAMKGVSLAASIFTTSPLDLAKKASGALFGGGEAESAPGTPAADKKAAREAQRQAIIDAFRPGGGAAEAEGVNIPVQSKPMIEPIVSELGRIGGASGGGFGGGFADNSTVLLDVNRQQVNILQEIRDALQKGTRAQNLDFIHTVEPGLGYA